MSCQCQSDQLSVNSMNESAFVFNGSAPVISKLYCNSSEQLSCSSFSMDSKILPEKAKSLEGCETSIESTTMHKNSWYCNVSCEDLIPNADLDHLSLPNDNPANCQMHLSKSYNNISDLSNKKNCIDPKTKSVMFCHSSNANKDVAHHLLSKAHQGLVQRYWLCFLICICIFPFKVHNLQNLIVQKSCHFFFRGGSKDKFYAVFDS